MKKTAPLILIVGFLGAGKTTFLRELLPLVEARGLDPFVIINDYANARVDAASLKSEGRSVTPINGNCICCDSIFELMNVLLEIPDSDNRIVFIEANGTTDPTALVEHLLVNPELRKRFAPVLQVAVVDVKRWQKRHWHDELEHLQVETASHVLFTRTEKESKQRFATVQADIEWFNSRADWITHQPFALFLEKLVKEKPMASIPHDPQKCRHDHPQEDHKHHHSQHALSHAFVGLQMELPDPVPAKSFQQWLKTLPPDVLRVKGVVRLIEMPEKWLQFQRVDDFRGEAALMELPQKPELPACAVLIGVKLDEVSIRNEMIKILGQPLKKHHRGLPLGG